MKSLVTVALVLAASCAGANIPDEEKAAIRATVNSFLDAYYANQGVNSTHHGTHGESLKKRGQPYDLAGCTFHGEATFSNGVPSGIQSWGHVQRNARMRPAPDLGKVSYFTEPGMCRPGAHCLGNAEVDQEFTGKAVKTWNVAAELADYWIFWQAGELRGLDTLERLTAVPNKVMTWYAGLWNSGNEEWAGTTDPNVDAWAELQHVQAWNCPAR
ncbi:hypothetical protein DFJ77DRAFT_511686 [Powellomyces hirtus]|nr:hypothetical protein DFJ77DRAFT_511686 [Powellomyces hirtus]